MWENDTSGAHFRLVYSQPRVRKKNLCSCLSFFFSLSFLLAHQGGASRELIIAKCAILQKRLNGRKQRETVLLPPRLLRASNFPSFTPHARTKSRYIVDVTVILVSHTISDIDGDDIRLLLGCAALFSRNQSPPAFLFHCLTLISHLII